MNISYFNTERYPDPTAYKALSKVDQAEKRQYRPLVYICSPFSGDVEANVKQARFYSRYAVQKGYIPITPHLLYPQFLNDEDEGERELGLLFGKILLDKCAEVWVCGDRISAGMKAEIERAKQKRSRIRYFSAGMEERDGQ